MRDRSEDDEEAEDAEESEERVGERRLRADSTVKSSSSPKNESTAFGSLSISVHSEFKPRLLQHFFKLTFLIFCKKYF